MNGLEALKELRESATLIEEEFFLEDNREQLAVIEQELKALEIIKRNPKHIINALQNFPTYSAYKGYCDNCKMVVAITQHIKTQEEFDLLKEVLK